MKTITNFEKDQSKDKDFIEKYKDEIINVDCIHPITNKVEECLFYVNSKVTYRGTTKNVLNKSKFKKVHF